MNLFEVRPHLNLICQCFQEDYRGRLGTFNLGTFNRFTGRPRKFFRLFEFSTHPFFCDKSNKSKYVTLVLMELDYSSHIVIPRICTRKNCSPAYFPYSSLLSAPLLDRNLIATRNGGRFLEEHRGWNMIFRKETFSRQSFVWTVRALSLADFSALGDQRTWRNPLGCTQIYI